jgi:hypothetical protein
MRCRRLHLPSHCLRRVQILVVDESGLIDLPHLVDNAVGQASSSTHLLT